MRIPSVALVALLATETNAFVPYGLPKPRATKISMADGYDLGTNGASSTQAQVDDIRSKLQKELADATSARENLLREIQEAELQRKQLEAEAAASLAEAQAIKGASKGAATTGAATTGAVAGGLSGAIAPVAVGTVGLGALAYGRSLLEQRQKKIEEEKRIEAEKAAQAAAEKAAAEARGNLLAPLLGGAIAVTAAAGSFFGNSQVTPPPPAATQIVTPKMIRQAEAKAAQKQNELKKIDKLVVLKQKEEAELAKKLEAAASAAEKIAAEENAAERAAAEKAAEEAKAIEIKARIEAERAERARIEAAERVEAEKAAGEREAAERAAVEAKAAEEKARIEAEKAQNARIEAEKAEAERFAILKQQEEAEFAKKIQVAEVEARAAKEAAFRAQEKAAAEAAIAAAAKARPSPVNEAKSPYVGKLLSGKTTTSTASRESAGLSNTFGVNPVMIGAGVAITAVGIIAATSIAKDEGSEPESASDMPSSVPAKGSPPQTASFDADVSAYKDALSGTKPVQSVPPPASEISGAAVSSYFENISGSSNTVKKSYSPFGGGKPQAASRSDSLYAPPSSGTTTQSYPVESSTPSAGDAPNTAGGSYLDALGGNAAPLKKSYSPFGAKPKAASSDSLYAPPTHSSSTPKQPVDTSSPPVAAEAADTANGNYMDALGGSAAPAKKSFSPFGGAKPQAASGSDSLYAPPTASAPAQATSGSPLNGSGGSKKEPFSPFGKHRKTAATSPTANAPVAPNSSYMDVLGGGADAAQVRKSFSPFGTKPKASAPLDSSPPQATAGISYVDSLGGAPGAQVTKSFSPFGAKPKAAPASLPAESNGINGVNGASPVNGFEDAESYETSLQGSFYTSRAPVTSSNAGKKSFDPFGSKPTGNNSGGGYLDNL